jgi:hypothetical protein
VVVLGCQWIQVDDATPRSWPLKLDAVWRLSWSFRQSFCHLPEPSTWRSVHHMPSGSYGDSEHGRRCEGIISCARTVPARNHWHHSPGGVCVGRAVAVAAVRWTRKGNWQPHRRADVARHWQVGVTLFTCSVLVGMAIVAIAFIQLA